MSHELDRSGAYKCIVSHDNSAAELRVGTKSFGVRVLDMSRDGYTVRVPNSILKRIRSKPNLRLEYSGELWEVALDGEFSDSGEYSNLSLVRVRDLTTLKLPSAFQFSFGTMFSLNQDPTFLLGLLLAFLAACFCLPGIGDQVGTAPKISRSVKAAWQSFEKSYLP